MSLCYLSEVSFWRMSLCCLSEVSFWRMSLCWMSWRHQDRKSERCHNTQHNDTDLKKLIKLYGATTLLITTLCVLTLRITTLIILMLSITTLSMMMCIATLSILTSSITTIGITKTLNILTLSITTLDIAWCTGCRSCWVYFMLSVIMASVYTEWRLCSVWLCWVSLMPSVLF